MIDVHEMQALVGRLQSSGVTSFEWVGKQGRLQLRFAGPVQSAAPMASLIPEPGQQPVLSTGLVRSSGIGLFRRRHPLSQQSGLQAGDNARKGEILALLQLDELLLPVLADRDGVVGRFLAEDGDLIGYGAPLIEWR